MSELNTTWLGLALRTPFVVAACPVSDDVDHLARYVEAGASAVVMRSLFEEQIIAEQMAAHHLIDGRTDMDAESRSFMPESGTVTLGHEHYIRHLERIRARTGVPVIASLNGVTPGGWTEMARDLEAAGAAAIELNLYEVATDPQESGSEVETRQIETVRSVVGAVSVPVAVKLSPFYASVPAFCRQLAGAGAKGAVVFNRFYQPDVQLETLDLDTNLHLSTSAELPLRLHALALLHGRVALDLSAAGGVHTAEDAAKAIVCGANIVQMASALLENGPEYLAATVAAFAGWLAEQGYRDVAEARGVMSLENAPNPGAWERLNYMRMLAGWQPRAKRR
ncbi:MAG: dihydroorotate dehydrogenase-like protein [Gammaproteobacteria bacterium]|nr:dihydroorotate dehydrogenase-like protein [Gammaproteobacteria bacterium]